MFLKITESNRKSPLFHGITYWKISKDPLHYSCFFESISSDDNTTHLATITTVRLVNY